MSVLAVAVWIATAGPVLCSEPDSGGRDGVDVLHVRSIRCEEAGSDFTFSPLGLDFGIFGELYVVDSDNSRIFVLPDSLTDIALFARCPRDFSDCRLIDVETAISADVCVSERTSGSVLVFDRHGDFVSATELGEGLTGIGLGRADEVYAAMSIAGSVRIADRPGDSESIECPLPESDGAAYPVDCLAGKSGDVFVTDAFSGRVHVLSPLGEPRRSLAGFDFSSPFGLASYRDRYLLVSDSKLGLVSVFTADGVFLDCFGDHVLTTPTFIACRDDGTVCVADPGSMSIEVFRIETTAD